MAEPPPIPAADGATPRPFDRSLLHATLADAERAVDAARRAGEAAVPPPDQPPSGTGAERLASPGARALLSSVAGNDGAPRPVALAPGAPDAGRLRVGQEPAGRAGRPTDGITLPVVGSRLAGDAAPPAPAPAPSGAAGHTVPPGPIVLPGSTVRPLPAGPRGASGAAAPTRPTLPAMPTVRAVPDAGAAPPPDTLASQSPAPSRSPAPVGSPGSARGAVGRPEAAGTPHPDEGPRPAVRPWQPSDDDILPHRPTRHSRRPGRR